MICRKCGSDDLMYDSDGIPECLVCGFRDIDADEAMSSSHGLSLVDDDDGPQGCFDELAEA